LKSEKRLRKREVPKPDGRYLIYYERKPAARRQVPEPHRADQAETPAGGR